jgi:hypothetical protein
MEVKIAPAIPKKFGPGGDKFDFHGGEEKNVVRRAQNEGAIH